MTTDYSRKLLPSEPVQNGIPYYANWLGPWAIHEPAFKALEHAFQTLDLPRHLQEVAPKHRDAIAETGRYETTVIDGIMIVNINGPIMKHDSSFGYSCSSVRIRRILDLAKNDPSVFGVLLRIDSPGGTVNGTRELANDVAKFSKVKPISAYCEDLTASAAYWIACQSSHIVASPTSLVGSIGTYCVVRDFSGAAEQAGVKVHVVRAGEFKGVGEHGTAILDSHLMEMQRQVDGLNAFFTEAVSTGRSLEGTALEQVTDGRAHLAADAMRYGLIDEIADFEDYFGKFFDEVQQSKFYQSSPNRFVSMGDLAFHRLPDATKQRLVAERTPYADAIAWASANQAATRNDLYTISGGSETFISECTAKGLSIAEAEKVWKQKQDAENAYALKSRMRY
jgi:signal peptide peptidase SppA